MRLIDADAFKKQIAAVTVTDNLDPQKSNMMCLLIDGQPTVFDIDAVLKELDKRINIQLNILSGLNDPVYRYGYTKSLETYQQCKLILEDLLN